MDLDRAWACPFMLMKAVTLCMWSVLNIFAHDPGKERFLLCHAVRTSCWLRTQAAELAFRDAFQSLTHLSALKSALPTKA